MTTAISSAAGRHVSHGSLSIGYVLAIEPDGYLLVASSDSEATRRCQVLRSSERQPPIPVGATVLLAHVHADADSTPVVLGEIGVLGPSAEPSDGSEPVSGAGVPDSLLLEAKQALTLRVGDGSITIRADGKILIKGKDLVSHAQRVNRIKGGSVAIN